MRDKSLANYRHIREKPALYFCILLLIGAVLLGLSFGAQKILLGFLALWVAMFSAANLAQTRYGLKGAKVSAKQLPEIYKIKREIAARFHMPEFNIYIVESPHPKAFSLGLGAPYTMVLTSTLLEILDEDELRFIIGSQAGHILFGHTKVSIFLGGDEKGLPAIVAWVGKFRDLFIAWYHRYECYSADRIGILAVGQVEVAMRACAKIGIGIPAEQINVKEMAKEVIATRSTRIRKVKRWLVEAPETEPTLATRLIQMAKWAGLPENKKYN